MGTYFIYLFIFTLTEYMKCNIKSKLPDHLTVEQHEFMIHPAFIHLSS